MSNYVLCAKGWMTMSGKKDHLEVYLAPFVHEDLSDIADEKAWSRTALEGLIAERALRKGDYPPASGERLAFDRDIDLLSFELTERAKEGL